MRVCPKGGRDGTVCASDPETSMSRGRAGLQADGWQAIRWLREREVAMINLDYDQGSTGLDPWFSQDIGGSVAGGQAPQTGVIGEKGPARSIEDRTTDVQGPKVAGCVVFVTNLSMEKGRERSSVD